MSPFFVFSDELGQFFSDFKLLVEDTYVKNNNSKVIILAHSMGNANMLYFFNHQPQVWKDKYIEFWISLSGVWGGAVKPLRLMSSGENSSVFNVPHPVAGVFSFCAEVSFIYSAEVSFIYSAEVSFIYSAEVSFIYSAEVSFIYSIHPFKYMFHAKYFCRYNFCDGVSLNVLIHSFICSLYFFLIKSHFQLFVIYR